MSVFRIEKNKNYTVMSNYHLKEKGMSLKAKGMLSVMLSLPDDWDYSVEGLVAICNESKTTIQGVLKELEQFNYLIRQRVQNEKGQFEYEYNIFENPQREKPYTEKPRTEKPRTEKPHTEKPCTENMSQLNTNKLNTKELNTNIINTTINTKKETKHKYGEYQHILLTDTEYTKLQNDYGSSLTDIIKYVDEYIEMKGTKYKSHYLVIKKWGAEAALKKRSKEHIEAFREYLEN